jgi:hypothetical protein
MAETAYHQVKNLKLAAVLSAFGVPLVKPTITRVKIMTKRGPQQVIAYYFATESLSGLQTLQLLNAWDAPEQYVDAPPPLGLIPVLKTALDNRDEWVEVTKRLERDFAQFAAGNPGPVECERQLREAAEMAVPKVLTKRGRAFSILRANASKEEVKAYADLLRKVS